MLESDTYVILITKFWSGERLYFYVCL